MLDHDRDGNGASSYNSFTWWDKIPPPTGPIAQDFPCEFSTALATVVGSSTSSGPNSPVDQGFSVLPWDGGGLQSPNDIPGIPFAVRTQRPDSQPVLRAYSVAGRSTAPIVLANDPEPGHTLAQPEHGFRPSLWIDFNTPQRAVGLEYGYIAEPDHLEDFIRTPGVKLIAYDTHGRQITSSAGNQEGLGEGVLHSRKLDHKIGVRDQLGRIATVELRFGRDREDRPEGEQGDPILVPQAIFRVWHEPLPPAAVRQGVVGFEQREGQAGVELLPVEEFQQIYGQPPGPVTLQLPFRCDRALVLLRGMRVLALDRRPHPLKVIEIGVTQDRTELPLTETVPGSGLAVAPRSVTLSATGNFEAQDATMPPFRFIAYYTLIAWDSTQASIQTPSGELTTTSTEDHHDSALRVADPCGGSWPDAPSRTARCGPLLGALQRFRFQFPEAEDLDGWYLFPGYQRGFGLPSDRLSAALSANGNQITWGLSSLFDGDVQAGYTRTVAGAIMTGVGLYLGPEAREQLASGEVPATVNAYTEGSFPYITYRLPPRSSPSAYKITAGQYREGGWSWPAYGDVAFVGLHLFTFQPEGAIRELDIEVQGAFYDGHTIDWQLGGGVNTTDDDTDDGEYASAFPVFGVIRRNGPRGHARLNLAEIHLRNAVVGCDNQSDLGWIENGGDGSVSITEAAQRTGGDEAFFGYRFFWRGLELSADELQARLPIQLRPGERLQIRARYTPDRTAGIPGARRVHHSTLRLATNSPAYPQVLFNTDGATLAGTASARWDPESVTFGRRAPRRPRDPGLDDGTDASEVLQPRTKSALLVSTGQMPLCLRDLRLEHPNLGFSFRLLPLIEPEVSGVEITCLAQAVDGCHGSTHLIAETNAGQVRLPIYSSPADQPATPPSLPCDPSADPFHGRCP